MKTFTLQSFNEKAEQLKQEKEVSFIVEKGIPMPEPKERNFRDKVKATLETMEVGDSFVIDMGYSNNFYHYAQKMGLKTVSQKVNSTQLRIWRAE